MKWTLALGFGCASALNSTYPIPQSEIEEAVTPGDDERLQAEVGGSAPAAEADVMTAVMKSAKDVQPAKEPTDVDAPVKTEVDVAAKNLREAQAVSASARKYRKGAVYDQLQVAVLGASLSTQNPRRLADLHSVVDDCYNVQKYFKNHGAKIAVSRCVIPPDGQDMLDQLQTFLGKPGNAKAVYFSGHGIKGSGSWLLGENNGKQFTFSAENLVQALHKAKFTGVLTVISDSCFAGMWVKKMTQQMRELLEVGPKEKGKSLHILFRLSSSSDQCSSGWGNVGGDYTVEYLKVLQNEDYKPKDAGWGVSLWATSQPKEKDLVFKKNNGQVDLAVDIMYNPNPKLKRWSRYFPQSRKDKVGAAWPRDNPTSDAASR